MKEFMLLIRNQAAEKDAMASEQAKAFLKACEAYIEQLNSTGRLISAQPLARQGTMLSGTRDAWQEGAYTDTTEVIVGYYHLLANDLEEAIALAKDNPEFAFSQTARVEIRPVKTKEASTGFVYPGTPAHG